MKAIFQAVLAAALLAAPSAYGLPLEPIGMVRVIDGEVVIVRGGKAFQATPNLELFEGDAVETSAHGKVGLTMRDATTISLGHKSRLLLTKYQYHPQEKDGSFLVKLLKGTAAFLFGRISKLVPDSVQIQTPQAVVGVRGSHVLVKVD